ncbi:MAG: PorV/PorQ family protein [candidate division KSB1 bacterium]|nr:PorV/PorQ family protein [candidate division KSB1 bacterium]MDQ7063440.1 PorV/PorQ family protein [candidate division KSB1 bacterium]
MQRTSAQPADKQRRPQSWRLWLAGLLLGLPALAFGQTAGMQPVFKLGVGARAIGLGNAFVAYASDATAIYWNAAALDHLQRKNLVVFHTRLLEGAGYSFIGYAHPTVQTGTLGFGIINLSVGDVLNTSPDGVKLGKGSANRSQFLLSYAKQLPLPITVGATLKIERLQLLENNATGVGLDIGLLYHPDFEVSLLQNLTIGFNLQNAVAPRLKLVSEQEVQPWRFRMGLAKPIGFKGEGADGINILLGALIARDEPTRLNFGTEYIFQNRAFLRVGYNGQSLNFGAGVLYQNYRLDYAFGRYSDAASDFGPQHRLSLTVEFGKSKTQLIELAQQEELKRIEEETARKLAWQRQIEFENLLTRGKAYFNQGEYFPALLKFSAARDLFPENAEANQWMKRAEQKIAEERQKELQMVAERERLAAERESLQEFIKVQFEKGMRNLETKQYREAIAEWQRGLERDPENQLLKEWIAKTMTEIRQINRELLARARQAEKQNRITVALDLYDRILKQSYGEDEAERKRIEARIAQLRRQLTFNDLFRKGLTDYISKNYREAMKSFKEALKIRPDDPKVKQYLDDAEARANARVEDFASETIRRRFLEAVRYIQQENYETALQILLELQKQQRYNKRILDAIDLARERLQRR